MQLSFISFFFRYTYIFTLLDLYNFFVTLWVYIYIYVIQLPFLNAHSMIVDELKSKIECESIEDYFILFLL